MGIREEPAGYDDYDNDHDNDNETRKNASALALEKAAWYCQKCCEKSEAGESVDGYGGDYG